VDETLARELFAAKKPLGVDTASGVETNGKVDPEKIKAMHRAASEAQY
jgi:phosphoribosylanthranilate isomerase